MQRCGHGTVGPDLGGLTSLWIRRARKFDRGCVQESTKRRSKVRLDELYPLLKCLFSAMPTLEAVNMLVSIMMSVSLSNKGKPLKLRHYDISRAHFQGTAQRLIYIRLSRRGSSQVWLNRVFRVGVDETGQYLYIEFDLRHAPHINSESGCNTKTEQSSEHTTRETTGQIGVGWKTESDLEEG